MVRIRPESKEDHPAVFRLHSAAFPSDAEAKLVDLLREAATPTISLVAETAGEVQGHILFTPVISTDHPGSRIMGLAPMAVLPEAQGKGVGSALVQEGLERCRAMGVEAVVVLGHPGYYPRFGFVPASRFGITSEYDVPDEVFLMIELRPGSLAGKHGQVQYHEAFGAV